jgi:hypothetical protein
MDFWMCFWVTLLSVTHESSTSKCQTENNILIINSEYFTNLSVFYCPDNYEKLHTIHLINNNVSRLEATAFQEVSNLNHLLIIYNPLEYLHPKAFYNLKELISLDLSHNKLKSFTNELFISQCKLETLRLSYNIIISLDSRVLTPLLSLRVLDLSNNPFSCDCELGNTVKWCAERNLTTGATCDNGLLWTELKYENCTGYYHKEESSSMTCVLTGVGIVVVITVAIVVEVLVHRLRRTSRRGKSESDSATCEFEVASQDFSYEVSNARQKPQATEYFTRTLVCNESDLGPPQEHTEAITQPSKLQDMGKLPTLAAVKGGCMATDESAPYAEPLKHWLKEASVTYAEPYNQTTAMTTARDKQRMAELTVENTLYCRHYN